MSRYAWAYRDRHAAWPLGCVTIQARHSQGKRQEMAQEATVRAAAQGGGGGGAMTWHLRHSVRHGKACAATRLGVLCDTAGRALRHNQPDPRYGRGKATIRPGGGCNTAPSAPRHNQPSTHRARSLGHGCAPYALDPVLTQCIVSEPLFGTLFIRFFKKKNLNENKMK